MGCLTSANNQAIRFTPEDVAFLLIISNCIGDQLPLTPIPSPGGEGQGEGLYSYNN